MSDAWVNVSQIRPPQPQESVRYEKHNGGKTLRLVTHVDGWGRVAVAADILENLLLEVGYIRIEESDDLEPKA